MPLYLVTPPAIEPVSLAETKIHCRVDHTDDDARLLMLIVAARQTLDGRDGTLGRALLTQTWDYKINAFPDPDEGIELPLPPLQSVTSITYLDAAAATQTLATQVYRVEGIGSLMPARIVLTAGQSWPSIADRSEAATIRFVAGYATPNGVPEPIRAAINLKVQELYDQPDNSEMLQKAAMALLQPWKLPDLRI